MSSTFRFIKGFLSTLGLGHERGCHVASRQSLPPALFPTREYTASVSAWANSIQDLAENQECRVRCILHCKAKSGSRHEFLLVYVRHPSGKDAIVLADRGTLSDPSSVSDDGNTSPPYARGKAEMDMRALGIAPSYDRIRLSSDGTTTSLTRHVPAGWAEIHRVKFPKASEAPSVAHLAALLTVLDRHVFSPGASAEARNGWFVYCVVEVMREIFGGSVKTNKEWVREPYGGLKVEGRDTVGALIQEFKPAWEDFLRRMARGTVPSTSPKSKRRKEEAEKTAFADMLRTINP